MQHEQREAEDHPHIGQQQPGLTCCGRFRGHPREPARSPLRQEAAAGVGEVAGRNLRTRALGSRELFARVFDAALGCTCGLARIHFGDAGFAQFSLRGFRGLLGDIGRFARFSRFGFQITQAVLFSETSCGRCWCFSGGGKAVPTPEVAFLRDKTLAGAQTLLQLRAFALQHNTDL